jgi:BlaI family transcriptional regulator, penicillinase repressor
MPRLPVPPLTPVQFEIMQAVWDARGGAAVAEIWEAIAKRRRVGRTTILNLVTRLEQRGWLKRQRSDGSYRYFAAIDQAAATANAAAKFVDDFFGGSAKELVLSLLGTKRMSRHELEELRQLVERPGSPARKTKEISP